MDIIYLQMIQCIINVISNAKYVKRVVYLMSLIQKTADVIIDDNINSICFSPLVSMLEFNAHGDWENNKYQIMSVHKQVYNSMKDTYFDAVIITFTEISDKEKTNAVEILLSQFGNFISNVYEIDNFD